MYNIEYAVTWTFVCHATAGLSFCSKSDVWNLTVITPSWHVFFKCILHVTRGVLISSSLHWIFIVKYICYSVLTLQTNLGIIAYYQMVERYDGMMERGDRAMEPCDDTMERFNRKMKRWAPSYHRIVPSHRSMVRWHDGTSIYYDSILMICNYF